MKHLILYKNLNVYKIRLKISDVDWFYIICKDFAQTRKKMSLKLYMKKVVFIHWPIQYILFKYDSFCMLFLLTKTLYCNL